jgi:hypothetical protein
MDVLASLVDTTPLVADGSCSEKAHLQGLQCFATAAGAYVGALSSAGKPANGSHEAAVQCVDCLQKQLLLHPPDMVALQAVAADMLKVLREGLCRDC